MSSFPGAVLEITAQAREPRFHIVDRRESGDGPAGAGVEIRMRPGHDVLDVGLQDRNVTQGRHFGLAPHQVPGDGVTVQRVGDAPAVGDHHVICPERVYRRC